MRRRKGLRQSAFVGELISSGYISLIEQGKRLPSSQALAHIADVLGVAIAELTRSTDSELDPEQIALLAQTELLVTMADYGSAITTLGKLSVQARSCLHGRLLAVEIDYGLGNFVTAEIPIKDLIEELVALGDWALVRRAVIVCGRISDRLDTMLDTAIFLSGIKRKLDQIDDVDPLLQAQIRAGLATRINDLGDVATAQKLLTELEELLPQVKDFRGRASALWAKSNIAFENGNFELAIKCANEAQQLFAQEADTNSVLILQLVQADMVAECAPDGDPRLAAAEVEVSQLIQQRADAFALGQLSQLQLIHGDLLIRLGENERAETVFTKLLAQDRLDPENLAHANLRLGSIYAQYGDAGRAQKHLDKSWVLIRKMEPNYSVRVKLALLADEYQALGNQSRAIEVLRAMNQSVGNLSALLHNDK